jgi:hypothetical protein
VGGWVDGWMGGKAGLRIAYSNQQILTTTNKSRTWKTKHNEEIEKYKQKHNSLPA